MSFVVEAIGAALVALCRREDDVARGGLDEDRGGRADRRRAAASRACPARAGRRARAPATARASDGDEEVGARAASAGPAAARASRPQLELLARLQGLRVELRVQRLELGERDAGALRRSPTSVSPALTRVDPPRPSGVRLVGRCASTSVPRRALLGLRREPSSLAAVRACHDEQDRERAATSATGASQRAGLRCVLVIALRAG